MKTMEAGDLIGLGLSLIAFVFLALVIVLFVLSCEYYMGFAGH